jgi:ABC-type transport system involved in multi-copper enzyme maturation permease subunit
MIGLLRAEWMKVTRQGTTRILMGLLAGISVLFVIGLTMSVTATQPGSENLLLRQESFSRLGFPGGVFTGIDIIKNIGFLIVAIFFCSVIGSEYGLDTWKNLLVRSNARGGFLAAKLLVTGLALLVIFIITVAIAQLVALGGHALISASATQAGLTNQAVSAEQFFHNLWVQTIPLLLTYTVGAAFAAMFTIITRSTVSGILLTLVWGILDAAVSYLMPSVGDFTLTKNLASLGKHLNLAGSGDMPLWQNLAVFGVYFLIPMVAAIVIFRRRDMAGS